MEYLLWEHIERARDLVLNFFLFGPIDDVQPHARLAKALFYTRDAGTVLEASVNTLPSRDTWIGLVSEATGHPHTTPGAKRLRSLIRRCRDEQPQSEFFPCTTVLLLCVHGWLRGWSPVSMRLPRFTDRLLVPASPQTARPYTTCVELAFYHVLVLVHGTAKVLQKYGDVDNWITNKVEGLQNLGWKHSRSNHTELVSGEWSNLERLLVVRRKSVRHKLLQLGMRDVMTKNGPGAQWFVSFVHPLNLHVRMSSTRQHTAIYVQTHQGDDSSDNSRRTVVPLAWPATLDANQRLAYLLTTHRTRMPVCRHTVFALGGNFLRRFVHKEPSLGRCMLLRRALVTQSSLDAIDAVEAMAEGWLPLDPVDLHRYGTTPRIGLEVLQTGTVPRGVTDQARVYTARRKYPSPTIDWSIIIRRMVGSPSLVTAPLDVLARNMFRITPDGRLCTASGRLFGGKCRFETLCLGDTSMLQPALVDDETGTHSLLLLFASLRRWQCPIQLRGMELVRPRKTRLVHASTGDAWIQMIHKTLLSIVTNPTPLHRLTCRMFRINGPRLCPVGGWLFGGRRRFESLCLVTCPVLQPAITQDQFHTHVLLSLYAGLRQWLRPRAIRDFMLRHPSDIPSCSIAKKCLKQ